MSDDTKDDMDVLDDIAEHPSTFEEGVIARILRDHLSEEKQAEPPPSPWIPLPDGPGWWWVSRLRREKWHIDAIVYVLETAYWPYGYDVRYQRQVAPPPPEEVTK